MRRNRCGGVVHQDFVRALGAVTLLSSMVGGCASSGSSGGGFADKALDLIGLQSKPTASDISAVENQSKAKSVQKVTLRIHAGEVLNTNASGKSLALVVKVYILKGGEAFLRTPHEAFQEAAGKLAAIPGVIEVREVVLTPGQKYEVVETLPAEATHLAVVGLFRVRDDRRWRFLFDAKAASRTGITMGAHGCAFSVSEGQPVDAPVETLRLAGVRCQ